MDLIPCIGAGESLDVRVLLIVAPGIEADKYLVRLIELVVETNHAKVFGGSEWRKTAVVGELVYQKLSLRDVLWGDEKVRRLRWIDGKKLLQNLSTQC